MVFRRAVPTVLAVALLVLGQLAALAHEAGTRHVTCVEHGEQLEAAIIVGAQHGCDHARWLAVEGAGGGHSECEIARALHQSSTPGVAGAVHAAVAITETSSPTRLLAVDSHAALYRIAPKTSPPETSLRPLS